MSGPGDGSTNGKEAYLKAQRQRNLVIGIALGVFVVIVFFVSMSRMAQGVRHDAGQSTSASTSAQS